ncbi:hypothetical protein BCV72DRAFT_335230 [Rhizopus microsporus var. microsporus]|uniref:Uncharacterized protein n=1 Tax=Rhizopus microsporus var. microsporus TaxID=86635 RepID=A0A1X0R5U6_RHIZD|nr:hypothetical protein BCV72DRAFT_335230 [Rhizopus microsporus var. microsporus]
MPPLPAKVEEDLKEVEQTKHAFISEESFYEIYVYVIRLLHRKHSILKDERTRNATKQDFVNETWTPIMAKVFNDSDLILKWGDSVSQASIVAKKRSLPEGDAFGDRMDLGIMTSISGSMHDVLAGEFANSKLDPWKFTADHLKALRESKIILDHVVNQEFTTAHDARRLIVSSFQDNTLEDEVKITKLYAPGLFIIQYISAATVLLSMY